MNKLHIVFLLFILYANCPWEDPLLARHGDSRGRLEAWRTACKQFWDAGPSWRFAEGEKVIINGKQTDSEWLAHAESTGECMHTHTPATHMSHMWTAFTQPRLTRTRASVWRTYVISPVIFFHC